MTYTFRDTRLPPKFWDNIDVTPTGCWQWTGGLGSNGYGRMYFGGKRWQVHRLAYTALVAPVPDDLVIDHLCCNRACQNPAHLEPVTNAENIARADGAMSVRYARRMACNKGHLFTPENTYYYGPNKQWRKCKTCNREHAGAFHHDPAHHEDVLQKKREHERQLRADPVLRQKMNARHQARFHDPATRDAAYARTNAYSKAWHARRMQDPAYRDQVNAKRRAYRERKQQERAQ